MRVLLLFSCLALFAQDWPAHRGAARDGVYTGPVKLDWKARVPKQLWKVPVGKGYAGVSVADGKVFTVEQRKKEEAAVAYSFDTGKELWSNSWSASFESFLGGDGPRSTPTYDSGKVYVQGALGELRCIDAATGKTVWRKNVVAEFGGKTAGYGSSISPLIVGDLLVTHAGGRAGKSIVALRKDTGALAWSALDDEAAYTSPAIMTIRGERQIVTATADRVVGLKIDGGSLLWEFPWHTNYDVNAAQPVQAGGNRLMVSAGYGHGAALVEIGSNGKAAALWQNKLMKNKFNTSVFHDGHFYGLDENILNCIDAATGARKWKGGRYGYGQVALVGKGYLLLTAESGEVVLVKADPAQFAEVGKFEAIEGKTWNQPALAHGRLVVRNEKWMACYDLRD